MDIHSQKSHDLDTHNTTSKYTNRLINERSPYLLQHAHNPVNWYPWCEDAFEKAKAENKPIFLSVGYSTCHWCHVMERESFENEKTGVLLNRDFVSIKVDREERPDIDKVYMNFVQATTGSGGWPMNVFLTPNLEPFFGGTYFPPTNQYGRPSFASLLLQIAEKWHSNPKAILASGRQVVQLLRESAQKTSISTSNTTTELSSSSALCDLVNLDWIMACFQQLDATFDEEYGGFRTAPKFPTPTIFQFLFTFYALLKPAHEIHQLSELTDLELCQYIKDPSSMNRETMLSAAEKTVRQRKRDATRAFHMAQLTLRKMAGGGIHDHIAGGFHRYSTDEKWHVPHFEKMLYDQSQLVVAYLNAYLLSSGDDQRYFASVVKDILSYCLRDLYDSSTGAFYSAEDADSFPARESTVKREGAFAVWTQAEIMEILSASNVNENIAKLFCEFYSVNAGGNVDPSLDPHGELSNKNILMEKMSLRDFAIAVNEDEAALKRAFDEKCRRALLEERTQKRPKPHLDNKRLACWNGLQLSALARSAVLDPSYLTHAIRCANFLANELFDEQRGILLRMYTESRQESQGLVFGFADDYAFVIQGFLDLYEANLCDDHLLFAIRLQRIMDDLFYDHSIGGYFSTRDNQKDVLFRMKDDQDGVEPSSNSVALLNLQRLYHYTGEMQYEQKIREMLIYFRKTLASVPFSMVSMTSNCLLLKAGFKQIILTNEDDSRGELKRVIDRLYLPNKVIMTTKSTYLKGKHHTVELVMKAEEGKAAAAYVCQNAQCSLPVNDPKALETLLLQSHPHYFN